MNSKKVYIITRHTGAIKWVIEKLNLEDGSYFVMPFITEKDIEEMKNKTIIGVLPFWIVDKLLKNKNKVYVIQMPNIPSEKRGKEITKEQMIKYGAKLYEIKKLNMKVVE